MNMGASTAAIQGAQVAAWAGSGMKREDGERLHEVGEGIGLMGLGTVWAQGRESPRIIPGSVYNHCCHFLQGCQGLGDNYTFNS